MLNFGYRWKPMRSTRLKPLTIITLSNASVFIIIEFVHMVNVITYSN